MTEPAESRESRGGLGTVRNAVTLLELLAEGPAYQHLTDLAERSGMSVPTVHRLLRSLVLADLVEQDPRSSRYSLGPELVRLAHRYLARLPILGALGPYLTQLRQLVDATVAVQVLVRSSVVMIDRVDGPDSGLFREPHAVRPALDTAGGRLLAARASDEVWAEVLDQSDPADRSEARARRREWASAPWVRRPETSDGIPDQLAVPLVDAHGVTVAALAAAVPPGASEAAVSSIAAHLSRTATSAVRTLGHA